MKSQYHKARRALRQQRRKFVFKPAGARIPVSGYREFKPRPLEKRKPGLTFEP